MFNGGLSQRKAVYKPYPQAIPNAFAIEKLGVAPCRDACPINQRAQGYIALIREGVLPMPTAPLRKTIPSPRFVGGCATTVVKKPAREMTAIPR
jgi:NADPH-dependent glutamate synthase beta subunit-like oxidoreductase